MRLRKSQLVLIGIAVGVLAVVSIALAGHFDLRGQMIRVVDWVRAQGALPFFAAMALLPAVGFPLSAFTVVAGPVFGPTMGVGAVVLSGVLAIAVNVALSYWVSAQALHPLAARLVRWLGYPLPDIPRRSAWMAILILRLVPVTPFFLQSILLGLARVPFGPYMLVSVIVPSVYAAAMITLGDALMRGDRWAIVGAGALFVGVGTILHFIRKRLGRPAVPLATKAPPDPQRS